MKNRVTTVMAALALAIATILGVAFTPAQAAPVASTAPAHISPAPADPDRVCISLNSESGSTISVSYMTALGDTYTRTIYEGGCSHIHLPAFFYGFRIGKGWTCQSNYGGFYGPGWYPSTWIKGVIIMTCYPSWAWA